MSDTFTPAFGRIEAPDVRDRDYPMALAMPESLPPLPPFRHWRVPRVFDQGTTSSCVGQSWRAWLEASPIAVPPDVGLDALTIYAESQKRDPWAGEEPLVKGTSVRAAAKVLEEAGHIVSYHWAFEAETARRFVLTTGPIVIGVRWHEGMMRPKPNKPLDVSGPLVGGHAVLVCGYSEIIRCFRIQNSWTAAWSTGGRAWLRYEDLDRLLRDGGEACTAIEKLP